MRLLKLISCNPFVSFCKNSLIVDWRDQSLPRVCQVGPNWVNISWCCLFFSTLFILFILWLDCGFAMHLVSRLGLDYCCCLWLFWLLVAIDTCSTNLNFIDVKFGILTEFTTIGAHRGTRGEVCQVCTMGTKGYILEVETSMVQWKCMEALKLETVMLVILNFAASFSFLIWSMLLAFLNWSMFFLVNYYFSFEILNYFYRHVEYLIWMRGKIIMNF